MGYETTADLALQDQFSILDRGENDLRYYKMTQTLDEIMVPANNVSLGGNRITNLADAVDGTDALSK
jgi:hypothetical protein